MKRVLVLAGLLAATLWGDQKTEQWAARMMDRAATPAERNEVCGQLQGSEAIPHLEEALADEVVRACAAIQLRRLGASDSLRRAAQQGPPAVRARAIYELGVMKNPEAVDALITAARDADPLVSASGIHALLQYDDRRVLPALLEIASRQGVSSLAAVNSLGRFRDPSALPVLYGLLGSRDPMLRLAAIGALGDVGDAEAITKLQPLLQEQTDLRAPSGIGIGLFPAVNMARAAKVAIERIKAREESHAGR